VNQKGVYANEAAQMESGISTSSVPEEERCAVSSLVVVE